MRRTPLIAVLVAAVLAAALLPVPPAGAVTPLPWPEPEDVAVDGVHKRVFVSGGEGTSTIVVLDFDGKIVKTIAGQQGASGLVVHEASGTLYAALRDAGAISRIDTATLAETSRFSIAPLATPTDLAIAGGRLWFAHSCKLLARGAGSAGLDGTDVRSEPALPRSCPLFATSSGDGNLLAAGDSGSSPTTLYVLDAGASPPALLRSVRNPGGAGNLQDVALTPDALRILSASGAPYMVQSFLVSDLSAAGTYPTGPYPRAATVSADGQFVGVGVDSLNGKDVLVFRAGATTPLRSWVLEGAREIVAGGLDFSPDESRLFAVAVDIETDRAELRVFRNPTGAMVATATSLTVSKTTVGYGKAVKLVATVKGAKSGKIALYGTPYGGEKRLVKRAAVNAKGKASFKVKPAARTAYTAEYVESDTHASSASPARTVRVRVKAKAVLTGFYGRSGKYRLYRAGRQQDVRGTVAPKHPGASLRFTAQALRGGVWRTVATGTFPIQADGSAYAFLKGASPGRYRERVVFAGDGDHLGATSPWVYVEIRR